MFCYKCGHKCDETQLVCPECGTTLERKTKDTQHNPHAEIEDQSVLYIVLSALSLFFCNQITGIIALIFSILGTTDYNRGDYGAAKEKWKICKITLWIGLGITIAILVFVFAIWGFAIFGSLAALSSI